MSATATFATDGVRSPRIVLSDHCVVRFRERFRPAFDHDGAKRELARLLTCASFGEEPPAWLARTAQTLSPMYATVGPDLVLPLVPTADGFLAKTCIGRGGVSAPARERRNAAARARRSRRRSRR